MSGEGNDSGTTFVVGVIVGFAAAFTLVTWLSHSYANDRVDWERLTRVHEACSAATTTVNGRIVKSEPCLEFARFWARHEKNREGK